MNKTYKSLVEPLVQYTCEISPNLTTRELASIKLLYEVIVQGISDLESPNVQIRLDAEQYFESSTFDFHCESLGIPRETMLYIVNNPKRYQKTVGSYDLPEETEENNESYE